MSNFADDTLIYSVLDLITDKSGKGRGSIGDVSLIRDHPSDKFLVTGVIIRYKDGTRTEVGFARGSDDVSTYPEYVRDKPYHREYIYCQTMRLEDVFVTHFQDYDSAVYTMRINLIYNGDGLLQATDIDMI